MFKKIFPEKVSGNVETSQKIKNLEKAIRKVSEKHKLEKNGDEFIIIPKGRINFFGISNPMRNYKKIILKLIQKNSSEVEIEYLCYRKFSQLTSIVYPIFFMINIVMIAFTIFCMSSYNETFLAIAPFILVITIFWITLTICAFLFDYFILFSKNSIDNGFKKNILSRIIILSKKVSEK